MSTISDGTTSIDLDHVGAYESERQSGNVITPLVGTDDVDVAGRPASLRTGTLTLYFTTAAASFAAEELHRGAGVVVTLDGEDDTVDMSYVLNGRLARGQSSEDPDLWQLRVDFQEVRL